MTDEQLQSLFAGMERHLDQRMNAMEQRTEQLIAAAEQRILSELNAKMEALETRLLSEFWKWARGIEARMRMHDAINAATLERLAGIEERVLNLEKPPQ